MHNCDEVLYVLEGRGVFVIDGAEYEVEPGDSVYIAPNVVHGNYRNTGGTTWRYLVVVGQKLEPISMADITLA